MVDYLLSRRQLLGPVGICHSDRMHPRRFGCFQPPTRIFNYDALACRDWVFVFLRSLSEKEDYSLIAGKRGRLSKRKNSGMKSWR